MSLDMILPSFPEMRDEFGVPDSAVQLTLTGFLLGIAAGQFVFGPLSDRIGRRRPLIFGSILASFAAVAAAMAPTIEILVAARFAQGFTASAGIVLGRAILSDFFVGARAARGFSLLTAIAAIAPIVAPVIGGLMGPVTGYRGVLWLIAIMTALLVPAAFWLPEPPRREHEHVPWHDALRALARLRFVAPAIAAICAPATTIAFIASSSFVYQDLLGMDQTTYGVLFALNAVGVLGAGFASAALAHRIQPRRLMLLGVVLMGVGTLAVIASTTQFLPIWTIIFGIFVVIAGCGFVQALALAVALSGLNAARGTAASLIGGAQFALSALVAPLVSLGGTENLLPLVATVTFGTIACVVAVVVDYVGRVRTAS